MTHPTNRLLRRLVNATRTIAPLESSPTRSMPQPKSRLLAYRLWVEQKEAAALAAELASTVATRAEAQRHMEELNTWQ